MKRKVVCLLFSILVMLSMLASCSPAATTSTPQTGTGPTTAPATTTPSTTSPTSSDKPQYGGVLKLASQNDITTFDDVVTIIFGPGLTNSLTNETLWQGDWTKGHAGGYGTDETDWLDWYDIFSQKAGMVATSWKWSYDTANNQGILVYEIRPGIHWALDPTNEASRLVGGRELTVDDVIFSLKQVITDPRAYMYRAYPDLRGADIEQTGPWEITIKVPAAALIVAVAKFGAYVRIVPPEVVQKYGSMADWHNSVGSGPFILKDFVSGSVATLEKNPDYWAKDPIGPGKGNQLPYIDGLQYLIIPDMSTQQAAMRTGKIDRMLNLDYEDAAAMRKSAPDLVEGPGILGGPAKYVYMNSQVDPFNNVKVRQALMMATDLNTIKDTVDHGLGQILTWPVEYVPAYKDIYLGLDDPAMPASVKQLYTYNPDQAKQLLADAGFPNGFKTTALIAQNEVDYFSIIKDMWSKVGVELNLNVVDTGVRASLYRAGKYDIVGDAGGRGPISVFYHMVTMVGQGPAGGNGANINDPVLQQASTKMQEQYLTDTPASMATFKDLMKYVLGQAYVIPRPEYRQATFWWPWLKNYTGEYSVGYIRYDSWAQWIWIDQALKKSMGH